MAGEKKMKKCRNCGKEVEVDQEQNTEFIHDCGWSESKARAEVRRRQLMSEVEKELSEPEKKDKGKGIFGW